MGVITGATIHINYKAFGYKAVAHILINVEPEQSDQLVEYLHKMPEVYGFYNRGAKGNWDITVILKTLDDLNKIKDALKRNFSILDMKTAIWTDVKESNYNLALGYKSESSPVINYESLAIGKKHDQTVIDEIDQKIADNLAINGRVSMDLLAKGIGVSPETVKRRFRRLISKGILKVTIQIDPVILGYKAMCIFFTVTSHEKSYSIVDNICKIPNVISVMKTAGDYDLQIYAFVQDINQLLDIEEQIGKIQGITKIDSEILRIYEGLKKWPSPRQYMSTF